METLLLEADIQAACQVAKDNWQAGSVGHPAEQRDEGQALIEGLLLGWYRLHYNNFIEEYEVLSVEQDGHIPLGENVALIFKADVVVRSRFDGEIYVFNWKTTGRTWQWDAKWETDIQMWTEALAVEQALGESVRGCIVEGFHKGEFKFGHHQTPLLWAYELRLPDDMFIYASEYQRPSKALFFDEEKQEWRGPWKKIATWKTTFPFGEGMAAWVNFMPEARLAGSFVRSSPIERPPGVVEGWLQQVVRREGDVQHVLNEGSEEDQLLFFWQNFSDNNCRWCSFKPLCLGQTTVDEMLQGGLLKPRELSPMRRKIQEGEL
jgi:hypothetical protein